MTDLSQKSRKMSLRAHFISDIHWMDPGNYAAPHHVQALYASEADEFYFVGDTFDLDKIQRMYDKKSMPPHRKVEDVIAFTKQKLDPLLLPKVMLKKVQEGKRVALFTGNHDIAFEIMDGESIFDIDFLEKDVFKTDRGDVYDVQHGHHFDRALLQQNPFLYKMGSVAYDKCVSFDKFLANLNRREEPRFFWSKKAKNWAKDHVSGFMKGAILSLNGTDYNGVICGHKHEQASEIIMVGDQPRHYINCGGGELEATSVAYDRNGLWRSLGPADLPLSSRAVFEDRALDGFEAEAIRIVQKIWDKHLEYHNSPEYKDKIKNSYYGIPTGKLDPVVA